MNLIRCLLGLVISVGVLCAESPEKTNGVTNQAERSKSELTTAQKEFLSIYERVRASLAADDLEQTKAVAADFKEGIGVGLTKVKNLDQARFLFTKLSEIALPLANGREGYFIASCPMAGSDWVQTGAAIGNPYLGKKMAPCTKIRPATAP